MKILFIFTGGTIGSTRHGNVIATDSSKSREIIEAYIERYGVDFEYDTLEPYTELSENNTGAHIRALCECVRENILLGYDGIVVTHGTDTLQYSAAALGYCIGLDTVPVCMVSANRPIENPRSNALCNLRGAIKLIENSLGRGAFVVYKNDCETQTKVHRATRLIAGRSFSDEVESTFGCEYGSFDEKFNFTKNVRYAELEDTAPAIDPTGLCEFSESILFLRPYPGMRYPELDEKVKYVILDSYHSGTINTKAEKARAFFNEAKSKNITVFLCGVTDAPEYESATLFGELGIIPLKNISPVAAYIKLWLSSSSEHEVISLMSGSLSGDIHDYSIIIS